MMLFAKIRTIKSCAALCRTQAVLWLSVLAPFAAVAQAPPFPTTGKPDFTYFQLLVLGVRGMLNKLLPVVVTLALLFYFWQIALFILRADDPEARSRALHAMAWGLVALFAIVGVWGIVAILAQIFGVPLGGAAPVPAVAP